MFIGRVLEEKPLDMREFNPNQAAQVATDYLATLTNPRQRQILENFIEHAVAEANGHYEPLIKSCSRESQEYSAWGSGGDFSALLPHSVAAMEEHYRTLIDLNMYLIHLEVEKLIVGEDELCVDGIVHQLLSGETLTAIHGLEVDDPQAVYQLTKRTCIFFIFDAEGKSCGELAYANGPTITENISKVEPGLVPESFYQQLSGRPGYP